jgi:hypothetical protein
VGDVSESTTSQRRASKRIAKLVKKLVAKTNEKVPISATRKTNGGVHLTVAIVDR